MSGATTEVAYLTRALKMPRARELAPSLAATAREEAWDYLEFLAKVLSEEVASRETHGGENRVKAARFPQIKTLDDFDFSHQRSVSRSQIAHLHQLDFLREAKNVIFLGPPGTGKTHLSIALGVQAARRGHRVAFATATEWVLRLSEAKRAGKLSEELERLGRTPLLIVDEVGYIPFDPEAASLFFSLVSSRYERSSLIVSSNKSFSAWAEIFGDAVAVAAMVDRLVHHAVVIVLKGESYRLRGKGKEVMAAEQTG
jgi:DNA replication protein DnaC